MGHGSAPAGIDLDTSAPIDRGTSARTDSPTPAPIGLDAKSGDAKRARPYRRPDRRLRAPAVRSARRQRPVLRPGRHRAARREAKSAADYGKVSPNADYTWGTPVTLATLQPGDIIQFRNYTYESVVVTKTDKATTTDELAQDRPHHTAIVESVGENGAVTVLEQNAPDEGAPSRERSSTSRTQRRRAGTVRRRLKCAASSGSSARSALIAWSPAVSGGCASGRAFLRRGVGRKVTRVSTMPRTQLFF